MSEVWTKASDDHNPKQQCLFQSQGEVRSGWALLLHWQQHWRTQLGYVQATISVQNDIYTSNKAHNYGLQPISQKYKLLNPLKWFQCSPDWQWLHRTDIDPIVIQTFHCLYRWSTTLFHLFTHLINNMAVTCTWDQSINQSVLDHANWQQVSQLSALQPLRSILRRGILNVLYNYCQHHYQYHYFKQTCSEYETMPPPPPPTDTRKHALCMSTHTRTHTCPHIHVYTYTHHTPAHTHTSTCTHSHNLLRPKMWDPLTL